MEKKLYEAAVKGCVNSLLRLIDEDELIPDRFMASCFKETPLRIASMLGHLEFTKEMSSRKPQFAQEKDFHRQTPLHLAAANGHLEVVKALLLINPHVCHPEYRNGRNPVQIAIIKGRVKVLQELVRAKPEAVQLRGKGCETLLHLLCKNITSWRLWSC